MITLVQLGIAEDTTAGTPSIAAPTGLYAGTLDQGTQKNPSAAAAFGGRLVYGETVNDGPRTEEMKVANRRNS